MPSRLTLLLLTIVILAIIVPNTPSGGGALAFGAGNIPGFAYLEGKAFRHGDIEDVLADLLKKSAGSGLLGLGGGSKFGGLDVKRVYFGNWLRDYSQAVDIAGLKQVQIQTILNIVTVLGFMAHGYATGAFEVTAERLGTYLPVEHIDNPKGYGEGEDPRKYHPKLRGPVHPQEYAVDPRTGMKNYIANENGFWDTSKAHVRKLIISCIEEGRQYRQSKNQENKFNAYRTLGSALHTLEDFFAHSNFCELTLISIGGWNVFPHVGERTKIAAPNGQYVYPLVTGTFGGSDFIHSVLGEATDHLSQSSLTELNTQIDTANKKQSSGGVGSIGNIKALSSAIPGVGGPGGDMDREVDTMERNRAGTQGKDPNQMSPQEIRNAIWPVLLFRDNLVMKIEMVIEKIPGLKDALDNLMESIQVFVLTTLEPYIRPLIEAATKNLMETSGAVINNHDQFEVFNDPSCSDPTHSFLSKDHFNTILNEPAGNLAKIVVMYSVPLITAAWDNPSTNAQAVAEEILECLFHPDWHNRNSKIQVQIMTYMGKWMNSHGSGAQEVQRRLNKESVRNHQNIRFSGQSQGVVSADHVSQSKPKMDIPGLGIPGAPGLGGGGGGDPLASVIGALGKMGVSPGTGGPSRDFGSSDSYYSGGPQAPRYQPPPGPPGGRQPSIPSYGAPAYSPPAGPPPGRGGPGFPDAGSYRGDSGYKDDKYKGDSYDREKAEKKARKEEEKRKKKERKAKGEYGDRDYRPSDDSEDSGDDYRKKDKGEKSRAGAPWYEAPSGGYQLHGRDNERSRDGDRDRDRDHDRGYAPPAGPPPGGSNFGGSSFSMPSGPGGPPSFPSAPGFGGPPSFPSGPGFPQPNMNPAEFGNFFPPPGGPPPRQGGYPGSNNSGYPGAGGRHDYQGGSSGW
ncbi:hypothetical protein FRC01_006412 [Tulasnella sp. 417]|nr:hypothetical protein FRC01_006412 [Tulasnella sp. 417]